MLINNVEPLTYISIFENICRKPENRIWISLIPRHAVKFDAGKTVGGVITSHRGVGVLFHLGKPEMQSGGIFELIYWLKQYLRS